MRYLIPAFILLAIAGCAPPPKPASVPTPTPSPRPLPTPSPLPPPLPAEWNDWPFTPGDWNYRRDDRGSIALFGQIGANALLTVRCDTARAAVYLSVPGPAGNATVRTTAQARVIALQSTGGDTGYAASQIAPGDGLLDAMIFSRGRFVIDRAGQPPLVVRPFAELARVIEDCR